MQLYAVMVLCGIGFTMSLFISSLAFEAQGVDYLIDVKLGVLVGSLCAAIVGSVLIARS
jgi:NhaA family Na+:H+ antiporter